MRRGDPPQIPERIPSTTKPQPKRRRRDIISRPASGRSLRIKTLSIPIPRANMKITIGMSTTSGLRPVSEVSQ